MCSRMSITFLVRTPSTLDKLLSADAPRYIPSTIALARLLSVSIIPEDKMLAS